MIRRFVVAAIVALALAGIVAPEAAQADGGPAVTVTPSAALVDGQTVWVTAFGFVAADLPHLIRIVPTAYQCPAGLYASSSETPFDPQIGTAFQRNIEQHCAGLGQFPLAPLDAPTVTTSQFMVRRSVTTSSRTTFRCGLAQGDCVILVFSITTSFGIGTATTPITFSPPIPRTKDDCKNGGWRDHADDRGQPFASQGRCVSFVASHPK